MFDFSEVSELLNKKPNSYYNEIHLDVQKRQERNLNAYMIAERFQKEGMLALWQGKARFFIAGMRPEISFSISHLRNFAKGAPELFRHKDSFKKLLAESNILVSDGDVFEEGELDKGWAFLSNNPDTKYVIKPSCGHKGKGVTVGLSESEGYEEFKHAWELAVKNNRFNKKVIVEEQFSNGVEARFLVVGGKFVSAYRRIPPIVSGDGEKNIYELIEEKNSTWPQKLSATPKNFSKVLDLCPIQNSASKNVPPYR